MEHLGKILRKQTWTDTSSRNTDTCSGAEEAEAEPGSNCPVCKGAGFVHPILSSGRPDFSRVIPCRCVQESLTRERQTHLIKYSNLGALTRFTFSTLLPEGRSGNPANQEQFAQAYQAARTFASEPRGWLILTGPSGCGKTHLAAAIVNERISQGHPAFFISTPDLLDRLRSAFNPDSEMPYDEFFDQVRNAPLLILDDLGAQTSTPWAKEKLEQLLNYRFNSELPTVIIPIIAIEQLNDRIRTRLTDPDLCRTYGIEEKETPSEYSWGPEFELQKSMTFETFDHERLNLPREQRENLKHVFEGVFRFAQSPEGWLILQGANGCGKTHLAAAVVNYCYQAKKPALFVVVPEFLDHLRSAFNPESRVSYDQLFEKVKTAPLLVLDDFGEQTTTPWAQEKLYQVINYRYNAKLSTVITTRHTMDEIDSPISSRLVDAKLSTPFIITVPDYRSDRQPGPKARPRVVRKERWG
ncbi:MAG: ATP-binding protein [Dehalococcoidales bacterium]|nr:ATP-binding protein [Dehalococcoidales bacterium]